MKTITALTAVATLSLATSAQAAFMVTDGDFEASGDSTTFNVVDPVAGVGWAEENGSSNSNSSEFVISEDDSNTPDDGDALTSGDLFGVFGRGLEGRLYQSVGTYAGEVSVTVDFLAIDLTNQTFVPLTVGIWTGSGAPADGTLLSSLATLNDSEVIPAGTVDNANPVEAQSVTLEFDSNIATLGDTVYLSFSKTNTGVSAFDDVTIQAIPEPASAALVILGGLLMAGRRRR